MPQIDALDRGGSHQRDNLSHQAIEDYVKTIYALAQEESPVSTSRVAAARMVKPASATSMLQRLAKLGLVNYEKHYGATLTAAGDKLALEVIRHHRLLELYLMEALGFRWDEVHDQADILEHVISEKLEERIAAALNYPTFDPHGDPIPALDGSMAVIDTTALSDVPAGGRARVARIPDDSNWKMPSVRPSEKRRNASGSFSGIVERSTFRPVLLPADFTASSRIVSVMRPRKSIFRSPILSTDFISNWVVISSLLFL